VLHLPSSARTTALGDAWVAGRDQDVVFYNPAQLIGARPGLDLSMKRYGPAGSMGSITSIYAAGKLSLTLGWGAQLVNFRADAGAPYPYSPDTLLGNEPSSGSSSLMVVGGAVIYKGFRLGASGKYASDHGPLGQHAFLADFGVARNILGGVAAASVQNIGRRSLTFEDDDEEDEDGKGGLRDLGRRAIEDDEPPTIPRQVLAGWSTLKPVGPFDVGVFGQVTFRSGWTAPGAGVELAYSWIEGYTVTIRAGAHRPEFDAEKPFALGAAVTVDRLTVEYAVQFFDGGRSANGVTIRWR
jgi:hypothetical protein